MIKYFDVVEKIIAIFGLIICILAGTFRIMGKFNFMGLELITLFIVGMGVFLTAILLKLHLHS